MEIINKITEKINQLKQHIDDIDKTTEEIRSLLSRVYTNDFKICLQFTSTTIANRYVCNTANARKQIEELEALINQDIDAAYMNGGIR